MTTEERKAAWVAADKALAQAHLMVARYPDDPARQRALRGAEQEEKRTYWLYTSALAAAQKRGR